MIKPLNENVSENVNVTKEDRELEIFNKFEEIRKKTYKLDKDWSNEIEFVVRSIIQTLKEDVEWVGSECIGLKQLIDEFETMAKNKKFELSSSSVQGLFYFLTKVKGVGAKATFNRWISVYSQLLPIVQEFEKDQTILRQISQELENLSKSENEETKNENQ